ncbi:epoxide hydrolase family protein [Streptomyces althioticus]|uniref:epoxide hydrolase family protein n=1 Tax=Streptomyces althioticus TaxID=83380 RepID=UPI0036A3EEC3
MQLHVPESMLRDLRQRLEMARWPAEELVDDWSQGAPLWRVKHLVEYWKRHYDWRRVESLLNSFGQYRTVIDGVSIHLLHARSPHAEAMPIMLTHGWPGSVLEFRNVIRRLTHPTEFGGSQRDAFHVVVPSLPGFGFSDQPDDLGWGRVRTAKAWAEIMPRLGYDHYLSQGGDWGAAVNAQLGVLRPKGLLGIHLNFPQIVPPDLDLDHLTPEEQAAMDQLNRQQQNEIGYQLEMMTRPQTVSYSLADSPVGQAAWIYEKFGVWSDSNKNPESIWTLDEAGRRRHCASLPPHERVRCTVPLRAATQARRCPRLARRRRDRNALAGPGDCRRVPASTADRLSAFNGAQQSMHDTRRDAASAVLGHPPRTPGGVHQLSPG